MKVLIVSANTGQYPDPVFPLGACYIASACQQNNFTVKTFDCNSYEDIKGNLKEILENFSPDCIGISMRNVDDVSYPKSFSFLPHYKKLVTICREFSKAQIIIGGSAVALFPEEYYKVLQPDYCIAGEGEISFITLLEQLRNGQKTDTIIYADKLDLNTCIHKPDRNLFNVQSYYDLGGMLNIQTKRGCNFNCSFCTFPYLEGRRVRTRPAMDIVDEMEQIVNQYNVKHLFVVDSVFNYPEDHVVAICEEILKRSLRMKWTCYMRPHMDDLEILGLMKQAGCSSVELGTESMAEETLRSLNKNLTVDDIIRFCEKCREVHLPFCHSIIFGAPKETRKTVKTTITNVEATDPTAVIAIIGIRVYPNTQLADLLVENGYFKSRQDIGLESVFYIDEGVKAWIFDFLENVAQTNKKWIVPGRESLERDFIKRIRKMKKKGSAWEFKQFEEFIE